MAAVLAVLLAGGGYLLARATEPASTSPARSTATTPPSSAVTAPPVVNNNTDEPIAAVAAALSPSVVQIETRTGLGSGVVYDNDGHILTAAHVVTDAGSSVRVRLADGKVRTGSVVGSDDTTDIAVIKVDPDGLKPAVLATGVQLQVGQTAVAVGSPFGLDQTVTAGIISAIDRAEQTLAGAIGMIQTDAPINPGNSGGPLADKQGRVIGINDQIESSTGTNSGVGFAIPIDVAKAVADKLVAGEPVEFGFLGVSTEPSRRLGTGDGATVISIEPGSAAAKAGLTQGDEIIAIDGQPVHDPVELGARVRGHKPGDNVELTIRRDGGEQTVNVTLGSTRR
jgi:putative serine protease PepD